jgi:hypothetical protein
MQKQFRECPLSRFELIEPGITGVELFDQPDDIARELLYGLRHADKTFSRRQSAQRVACLGKIVAHGMPDVISASCLTRMERGQ